MDARTAYSRRKKTPTVVEEIWDQLRARILRGDLAPGARLMELEIATLTGASQGSVREALQRLEGDGLVERRARAGTFVTELSRDGMHEIFLVRRVVESAAIRRAIRRIGPEQIRELEDLVERMREAGRKGDAAMLVKHDMAFHHLVCTWADHPTLLRQWVLIESQLERFLIIQDILDYTDLSQVAENHQPILEAIEAGDEDLAAERVASHVMLGAPPPGS